MVRQTTLEDLRLDLRDKLLAERDIRNECPNLRTDSKGPYCGRDLTEGQNISDERRRICDNYSLQLWCLDRDKFHVCIWYQGEPFKEI